MSVGTIVNTLRMYTLPNEKYFICKEPREIDYCPLERIFGVIEPTIKFTEADFIIDEKLTEELLKTAVPIEEADIQIKVAEGPGADRFHSFNNDGFEILYNMDTGEVLDYHVSFFSDDYKGSDFTNAYRNNHTRTSVDMLTERYEVLWGKISKLDLGEKQKAFLRSKLNESFEQICSLCAFDDVPYTVNDVKRLPTSTSSYKRDFARAFIEAYSKKNDRIDSVKQAFNYVEKNWGASLVYFYDIIL